MYQSILHFLHEWLRRPSWIPSVGMIAGFLLFLVGVIWKVPRERKLGLAAMGLFLFLGIIFYFYG